MVKADICNINIRTRCFLDIIKHINGNIAKTDIFNIRIIENKLGDNTRGIGKVDKPCVGANSLDPVTNMLDDGNRSQSLKHSAYTGCFLTDKVILLGNTLVKIACVQHSYTNLCNNKICALKCKVKIICHYNLAVNAGFFEHTNAEVSDDCAFSLVNIHKGYFFKLKRIGSLEESVNQLGTICTA